MKGSARSRLGVSVTLTTALLAGCLLSVAVVTAYLATDLVEVQSENTEFRQALDAYLLLAHLIEKTSCKPGSSSYVVLNLRSGSPQWFEANATLSVDVEDGVWRPPLLQGLQIRLLKYRGGSLVSAGDEYVRGDGHLVVTQLSDSLVTVCENHSSGAWATLSAARVQILDKGSAFFLMGNDSYERYRVVEINCIQLFRGDFSGSDRLYTRVHCAEISSDVHVFPGQTSVRVTARAFGVAESVVVSGGPEVAGTAVYVRLSRVEVSFI